MGFEQNLRDQIKGLKFNPETALERSILKTLLGEIQQKGAIKPLSDESCHKVVKDTIETNNKTLAYLPEGDARRTAYLEENRIMQKLLPTYWTAEQIKAAVPLADIQAAKNEGMAIGVAVKALKALNAPVENDTVRSVVVELRKVSS